MIFSWQPYTESVRIQLLGRPPPIEWGFRKKQVKEKKKRNWKMKPINQKSAKNTNIYIRTRKCLTVNTGAPEPWGQLPPFPKQCQGSTYTVAFFLQKLWKSCVIHMKRNWEMFSSNSAQIWKYLKFLSKTVPRFPPWMFLYACTKPLLDKKFPLQIYCITLWNNINPDLKLCNSFPNFKIKLKHKLLQQYLDN
jgi:hypothetical protein